MADWRDNLSDYLALPLAYGAGMAKNTQRVADAAMGMVNSAKSVMLPGDVAMGRVDPMSDEGFARAQELAGLVSGGGFAMEKPAGALGMSAGRVSKPAKAAAQAAAPQVESAGLGMLPPLEQIMPGDYRISTRQPSGVKAQENPLTHHLSIGLPETVNSPTWQRNQTLLPEYAGFAKLRDMAPDEVPEAYVNQMRDNLNFLYENAPQIMQQRSPRWYEGANRISQAWADRWGVPRQAVSGAIAALSPQLDWNINASLAERAGDALFGRASSMRMTPEMEALIKSKSAFHEPQNIDSMRAIMGKRLSDLTDPEEQAMWIRAYDEAHNPRSHRAILPEGDLGDFMTNKGGGQKSAMWMNFGNLAKAVQALQSGGDMNVISPLMGSAHKVRNFYNNIEVPFDLRYGDVTGDTHQMAAGHLMPYSGKSPAVSHNLGTGLAKKDQPPGYVGAAGSSLDGVQGTYGLLAEATRRAGADQGLLPRAMQSATWEPVRELFEASAKRGNLPNIVDEIWRAHDAGDTTADQARRTILEVSGGIGMPAWAKPGAKIYDPQRGSTYR